MIAIKILIIEALDKQIKILKEKLEQEINPELNSEALNRLLEARIKVQISKDL